ncbi:mucin-5B-like [Bubalus kerabau]|uniref:mucin-5B-like n=1 Tax=Bubalus carabanensis TaxID=3119969 RepID=UPI00244EF7A0|nr:mucin-5B-like [Bubalus carabanensis]
MQMGGDTQDGVQQSWTSQQPEMTARHLTFIPPITVFPTMSPLNAAHGGRVCSTWGDFHYKTFDGDVFRFPGLCNYVFSAHCGSAYEDFNLQLRRGLLGSRPTITHIVLRSQGLVLEVSNGSVLINGWREELPYSRAGLLVERSSAYVKINIRLMLTFMWNGEDSALLELDPKYANQTCGLCGDFNGLRAVSEFYAHNARLSPLQFGNLQKLDGPTEQCQDPLPSPAADDCRDEEGFCRRTLLGPAFAPCHGLVDTEVYVAACTQDLCRCPTCPCATFAEYSRQCAHAGGQPQNWRGPDLCPQTCPLNTQHQECGSPCVDTCSNPERSQLCEDHCVDGCFCPPDTVLDDVTHTGCLPLRQCPCTHGGRTYAPGASFNTSCTSCTCSGGLWQCQDLPCPGTCSVQGGSHISTYDEKLYDVHGDCSYVLTKVCADSALTVLAELRKCGLTDNENCLKTVTLSLNGGDTTVQIQANGGVFVNSIYSQLPVSVADVTVFRPSSFFILVQTGPWLQLQVQLVPLMQAFLWLDPAYRGQMCGLCGNFNQNQADDFRTVGGVVEATAAAFANTWKTQAACPNVKNSFEDPCSLSVENENYAQHWCSLLTRPAGPFSPCHSVVSPGPFHSNCLFDTCNCEKSEDCMCAALSSYVRACAARGVLLSGWRDGVCTKYASSCPKTQSYAHVVDSCQPTCRSLSQPDVSCDVAFVPVDGCVCPRGTFLDDAGDCVPAEACPCYLRGTVLAPGEVVHDNGVVCSCVSGRLSCLGATEQSAGCVAPMVFLDCSNASADAPGAECVRSCHSLDVDCFSTHCVSGCVCPVGLLSDGSGGCVAEEDCPCMHNEAAYKPGEVIKVDCNTCTCRGRRWECSDRPCLGTCVAYGDGHFLTFDGERYGFEGSCEYTLAQDYCVGSDTANGTFRIVTESVPCGTTGATCSKAIKIFLGSYELILHEGTHRVLQRGPGGDLPYRVRYMGVYLTVETHGGVVVSWDRKTSVIIRLRHEYKGRVCGLCGNFDDNALNDFTTRSQSVVGDVLEFGNSWKFSPSCPDALAPRDPCTANPFRRSWAQKQCSIINSATFSACRSQVDSTRYYEACVSDACACDSGGDCECFCTAVAAYAQACHEAGVCVSWRTPDVCPLFCDFYNPHGDCEWHYQPCGAPCLKTCRNPSGLCLMELPGLEGCYPKCPSSKPFFNEDQMECVAQCSGCYDGDGNYYDAGTRVPTTENCQSCACTPSGLQCAHSPEACTCTYEGRTYAYGDVIYNTTDGLGACLIAICRDNGTILRRALECPGTLPKTPFTFTFTSTAAPPSTTGLVPTPSTVCVRKVCHWSKWYDGGHPEPGMSGGDFETFENLRQRGYQVCLAPVDIECQAQLLPDIPLEKLGQKVECSRDKGLTCFNSEQSPPLCLNYKLRVLCCDYVPCVTSQPPSSQTTPSTGASHPPMAASTSQSPSSKLTTTTTPQGSSSVFPATTTCEPHCHWTEWFDVDYPKYEEGGGDFETYEKIRGAGGAVCKQPQEIECEAENYPGLTPEQVGQRVHCDVHLGLVCRNEEQLGLFKMCYNYRMRVLCCEHNRCTLPTATTAPTAPTATATTSTATVPTATTATATTSTAAAATATTATVPTAAARVPTANATTVTVSMATPSTAPGTTATAPTPTVPTATTATVPTAATTTATVPTATATSATVPTTTTSMAPATTVTAPTSTVPTVTTATVSMATASTATVPTATTATTATATVPTATASTSTAATAATAAVPTATTATVPTATTSTATATVPTATTATVPTAAISTGTVPTASAASSTTSTAVPTPTQTRTQTGSTVVTGSPASSATPAPALSTQLTTRGTASSPGHTGTHPTSPPGSTGPTSPGTATSVLPTRKTSVGPTSVLATTQTSTAWPPTETALSTTRTPSTQHPETSTPAPTTATTGATTSQGTTSCQPKCKWTEWFDVDYPKYEEGGGDFETYEKIRDTGGAVCKQPQEIECEAENYPGLTPEQVGQQVHCDVHVGLVCRNNEQLGLFKMCYNYRMRVLCCEHNRCTLPTATMAPTATATASTATVPTATTATATTSTATVPTATTSTATATMPTATTSTATISTAATSNATARTATVVTATVPTAAISTGTVPTASAASSTTSTAVPTPTQTRTQTGSTVVTGSPASSATPAPALSTRLTTRGTASSPGHTGTHPTSPPGSTGSTSLGTATSVLPTHKTSQGPTSVLATTQTSTAQPPTEIPLSTTRTPSTQHPETSTPAPTTATTGPTTSQGTTSCQPKCKWTEWFDVDYPKYEEGGGDFETYEKIRGAGGAVCKQPQEIECEAENYPGLTPEQVGQRVHCDVHLGLVCRNEEQLGLFKMCYNYRMRVLCCEHNRCTLPTATTAPTATATTSTATVPTATSSIATATTATARTPTVPTATSTATISTAATSNATARTAAVVTATVPTAAISTGTVPTASAASSTTSTAVPTPTQTRTQMGSTVVTGSPASSATPVPALSTQLTTRGTASSPGHTGTHPTSPPGSTGSTSLGTATSVLPTQKTSVGPTSVLATTQTSTVWPPTEIALSTTRTPSTQHPETSTPAPTTATTGPTTSQGTTSCQPKCKWTEWFDVDYPKYEEGGGDFETYDKIRGAGGAVCKQPQEIECEAENYPGLTPEQVGQRVHCDVHLGLVCRNDEQLGLFKMCYNYRMRVLCCEHNRCTLPTATTAPTATATASTATEPPATTATVPMVTTSTATATVPTATTATVPTAAISTGTVPTASAASSTTSTAVPTPTQTRTQTGSTVVTGSPASSATPAPALSTRLTTRGMASSPGHTGTHPTSPPGSTGPTSPGTATSVLPTYKTSQGPTSVLATTQTSTAWPPTETALSTTRTPSTQHPETSTPAPATATTGATTSQGMTSCQPKCKWTEWFDVDFPTSGVMGGDIETYDNIRAAGGKMCQDPEKIECRAENYPEVSIDQIGQVLSCSLETGLVCRNEDQRGPFTMCFNYNIRVYCCDDVQHCPTTATPGLRSTSLPPGSSTATGPWPPTSTTTWPPFSSSKVLPMTPKPTLTGASSTVTVVTSHVLESTSVTNLLPSPAMPTTRATTHTQFLPPTTSKGTTQITELPTRPSETTIRPPVTTLSTGQATSGTGAGTRTSLSPPGPEPSTSSLGTTLGPPTTTSSVATLSSPKTHTSGTTLVPTSPGTESTTCERRCAWTDWMDQSYPMPGAYGGDYETYANIRAAGGAICEQPLKLECRAEELPDIPLLDLGQVVLCELEVGLVCRNQDQSGQMCLNYQIRLLCCDKSYCPSTAITTSTPTSETGLSSTATTERVSIPTSVTGPSSTVTTERVSTPMSLPGPSSTVTSGVVSTTTSVKGPSSKATTKRRVSTSTSVTGPSSLVTTKRVSTPTSVTGPSSLVTTKRVSTPTSVTGPSSAATTERVSTPTSVTGPSSAATTERVSTPTSVMGPSSTVTSERVSTFTSVTGPSSIAATERVSTPTSVPGSSSKATTERVSTSTSVTEPSSMVTTERTSTPTSVTGPSSTATTERVSTPTSVTEPSSTVTTERTSTPTSVTGPSSTATTERVSTPTSVTGPPSTVTTERVSTPTSVTGPSSTVTTETTERVSTPTSVTGPSTTVTTEGTSVPTSVTGPSSTATTERISTPTSVTGPSSTVTTERTSTPTSVTGPSSTATTERVSTPTSVTGPSSTVTTESTSTPTSVTGPSSTATMERVSTPTSMTGPSSMVTTERTSTPTSVTGPSSKATTERVSTPTSVTGPSSTVTTEGVSTPTSVTGPSSTATTEMVSTPTSVTGPSSTVTTERVSTPTSVTGPSSTVTTRVATPTSVTGPSSTVTTKRVSIPTSVPGPSSTATTEMVSTSTSVTGPSSLVTTERVSTSTSVTGPSSMVTTERTSTPTSVTGPSSTATTERVSTPTSVTEPSSMVTTERTSTPTSVTGPSSTATTKRVSTPTSVTEPSSTVTTERTSTHTIVTGPSSTATTERVSTPTSVTGPSSTVTTESTSTPTSVTGPSSTVTTESTSTPTSVTGPSSKGTTARTYTPTSVPGPSSTVTSERVSTPTSVTGPSSTATMERVSTPTSMTGPSSMVTTERTSTPTSVTGPSSKATTERVSTPTSVTGPSSTVTTEGVSTPTSVTGPSSTATTEMVSTPTSVTGPSSTVTTERVSTPTSVTGPSSTVTTVRTSTPTSVTGPSSKATMERVSTPSRVSIPTSVPGPSSTATTEMVSTSTSVTGPSSMVTTERTSTPTSVTGPSSTATTERVSTPTSVTEPSSMVTTERTSTPTSVTGPSSTATTKRVSTPTSVTEPSSTVTTERTSTHTSVTGPSSTATTKRVSTPTSVTGPSSTVTTERTSTHTSVTGPSSTATTKRRVSTPTSVTGPSSTATTERVSTPTSVTGPSSTVTTERVSTPTSVTGPSSTATTERVSTPTSVTGPSSTATTERVSTPSSVTRSSSTVTTERVSTPTSVTGPSSTVTTERVSTPTSVTGPSSTVTTERVSTPTSVTGPSSTAPTERVSTPTSVTGPSSTATTERVSTPTGVTGPSSTVTTERVSTPTSVTGPSSTATTERVSTPTSCDRTLLHSDHREGLHPHQCDRTFLHSDHREGLHTHECDRTLFHRTTARTYTPTSVPGPSSTVTSERVSTPTSVTGPSSMVTTERTSTPISVTGPSSTATTERISTPTSCDKIFLHSDHREGLHPHQCDRTLLHSDHREGLHPHQCDRTLLHSDHREATTERVSTPTSVTGLSSTVTTERVSTPTSVTGPSSTVTTERCDRSLLHSDHQEGLYPHECDRTLFHTTTERVSTPTSVTGPSSTVTTERTSTPTSVTGPSSTATTERTSTPTSVPGPSSTATTQRTSTPTRTSGSLMPSIVPTTSPSPTTPCLCHAFGKFFLPGDIVYNKTDAAGCPFLAICNQRCDLDRFQGACTTSSPPGTSASVPPTTPVSGCDRTIPPRKVNESWLLEDCTVARCEGDNRITLLGPRPMSSVTCVNGHLPVRVQNQSHRCDYHYTCECVCSGWGDTHYETFDGTSYSFWDNCTYVLMREIQPRHGNLRILLHSRFCEAAAHCPRALSIHYQSMDIVLSTTTSAGGQEESLMLLDQTRVRQSFSKSGVIVTLTGATGMRVDIPAVGAVITFNGRVFQARLSYSRFSHNTEGQCGTCTNNRGDECRRPDGTMARTCRDMARSWLVSDSSVEGCGVPTGLPPTTSPLLPETSTPAIHPSCPPEPLCELMLSSVFAGCHSLIPPGPYFNACVSDSCWPGRGREVLCQSLEAYAELCRSRGVCPDWRNATHGLCDLTCPSAKVYKSCGPVQPESCDSRSQSPLSVGLAEGCFCPDGHILFNSHRDICVPECPCVGPDGLPKFPGERWVSNCQDCVCDKDSVSVQCTPVQCPAPDQPQGCGRAGSVALSRPLADNPCCMENLCVCNASTCPQSPPACGLGEKLVRTQVEDDCCPTFSCQPLLCTFNGTFYGVGATIPGVTPCHTCTCLSMDSEDPTVRCEEEACNTTCLQGFEYSTVAGQCCGECVQTACLAPDGQLVQLNETWVNSLVDNCTEYHCQARDGPPMLTPTPVVCPDVHTNMTVLRHRGCVTQAAVKVSFCEGSCPEVSRYSMEAQARQCSCSCCQETRTHQEVVTMQCPDGTAFQHTYTHVDECSCVPVCASSPQTLEDSSSTFPVLGSTTV